MDKNPERSKKIVPNDQNLSLKEYFANLPKAERRPVIISAPKEELIEQISTLCGKTKMTARRWVYGYVEPCLAEKEKIATLLNCPVEVLFPERNTP
ncbi:MAG: hypothetical protein LUH10_05860 [Tannerellaceae bacterium]|nr:hypothetical protein [Tannerellaceae bacterium]